MFPFGRYDTLLISALVGLVTFDLLTLKLMRFIDAHGVGNLPTYSDISGTYCSRLMGQQLSDAPRDFATLAFDLGGHGACR